MSSPQRTVVAFALCTLAATPAAADELTHVASAHLLVQGTNQTGLVSTGSAELWLPAFDGSAGNLLAVEVRARLILSGRAGVENLGAHPGPVFSHVQGNFRAQRGDGLDLLHAAFGSQHLAYLAQADGVIDFAGPAGTTHLLAGGIGAQRDIAPDDRWLVPSGHGSSLVRIRLDMSAEHLASWLEPLLCGLTLTAELELSLTYVYQPTAPLGSGSPCEALAGSPELAAWRARALQAPESAPSRSTC